MQQSLKKEKQLKNKKIHYKNLERKVLAFLFCCEQENNAIKHLVFKQKYLIKLAKFVAIIYNICYNQSDKYKMFNQFDWQM